MWFTCGRNGAVRTDITHCGKIRTDLARLRLDFGALSLLYFIQVFTACRVAHTRQTQGDKKQEGNGPETTFAMASKGMCHNEDLMATEGIKVE